MDNWDESFCETLDLDIHDSYIRKGQLTLSWCIRFVTCVSD